ncbi:immunoglobulin heavy chain variable region [Anopheles sinensis]|uniref:Immunoglobulin heavy chain variable region n=1 Tax=Anopheles sinensis TaxID=74873 RepID=A0A084WEK6_ANOSI|nr:immunoglobulin heavy chain variable region [Anopheles sinensis]
MSIEGRRDPKSASRKLPGTRGDQNREFSRFDLKGSEEAEGSFPLPDERHIRMNHPPVNAQPELKPSECGVYPRTAGMNLPMNVGPPTSWL